MNLGGTEYSLERSCFEIYIAGCNKPRCPGCHNPELWEFDVGEPFTPRLVDNLIHKILTAKEMINKIWVLGGEPLDQDLELLAQVILALKEGTKLPLWLFTKREKDDVPKWCKKAFDFIKHGPYIQERSNPVVYFGVTLATDNQYIIRYDERGRPYDD